MKDEQLDDLKQFISSQISQSEIRIKKDIIETVDNKIDNLEKKLDEKIDGLQKIMEDGFTGVGEAIERSNTQIDDHDTRISTLEAQTA